MSEYLNTALHSKPIFRVPANLRSNYWGGTQYEDRVHIPFSGFVITDEALANTRAAYDKEHDLESVTPTTDSKDIQTKEADAEKKLIKSVKFNKSAA